MTSPFTNPFDPRSNPDNAAQSTHGTPSGEPVAGQPGPGQSYPPPENGFYATPQYGTDYTFGPPQPYTAAYEGTPRPAAPPSVVWAAVLCAVVAVVMLIGTLFNTIASSSTPYGSASGSVLIGIIGVLTAGGAAAMLTFHPGRAAQITATVVGALWVLSCIGLIGAIPLLLLLWASESSRRYFEACDQWRAANRS